MRIWEILFHQDRINRSDQIRGELVRAAADRSERALLRALELQEEVASYAARPPIKSKRKRTGN